MPLDDEGNIVSQQPTPSGERTHAESELSNLAPPGYGQHVLDQLYDDVDPNSIIPHSNLQSGINTPFYAQSRAGSSENLTLTGPNGAVPPAALSSRLQNVSLSQSNRNSSFLSNNSRSGTNTPFPQIDEDPSGEWSQPHSAELSRRTSIDEYSHSHSHSSTPPEPEHDEYLDLAQLSKVPSYTTATRTPLPRTNSYQGFFGGLPDYQTAMSAPASPTRIVLSDPMSTIAETTPAEDGEHHSTNVSPSVQHRPESMGFHFFPEAERRVRLMQSPRGT